MPSVDVRCQFALVYRHDQNPKGYDRFRCRDCHHRAFQLKYTNEAHKLRVKGQIVERAFNGSCIQDTARAVSTLLSAL